MVEVEELIRAIDFLSKLDPKRYTYMLTVMRNSAVQNLPISYRSIQDCVVVDKRERSSPPWCRATFRVFDRSGNDDAERKGTGKEGQAESRRDEKEIIVSDLLCLRRDRTLRSRLRKSQERRASSLRRS